MKHNMDVYIDPPSQAYFDNNLFDLDSSLNRDGSLLPTYRLKEKLNSEGVQINTADLYQSGNVAYYSLGVLRDFESLKSKGVELKSFFILEPPVVQPDLYAMLPYLSSIFERIFVHNVEGHGFSLSDVDTSKLEKFYWPQPYRQVNTKLWSKKDRLKKIVIINGNHKPKCLENELYSHRMKFISDYSKYGIVELYGRGWHRWWGRTSFWMPYWSI